MSGKLDAVHISSANISISHRRGRSPSHLQFFPSWVVLSIASSSARFNQYRSSHQSCRISPGRAPQTTPLTHPAYDTLTHWPLYDTLTHRPCVWHPCVWFSTERLTPIWACHFYLTYSPYLFNVLIQFPYSGLGWGDCVGSVGGGDWSGVGNIRQNQNRKRDS